MIKSSFKKQNPQVFITTNKIANFWSVEIMTMEKTMMNMMTMMKNLQNMKMSWVEIEIIILEIIITMVDINEYLLYVKIMSIPFV